MGDKALVFVSNGNIPSEEKWNQLKVAMVGDIPSRASDGTVDNEIGYLGTATNYWNNSYSRSIDFDSINYSYTDADDNADLGSMVRLYDLKVSHTPPSGYTLLDTYTITTRGLPFYLTLSIKNKVLSSTIIVAKLVIGDSELVVASTSTVTSPSVGRIYYFESGTTIQLYTNRSSGTSTTCDVEVIAREVI